MGGKGAYNMLQVKLVCSLTKSTYNTIDHLRNQLCLATRELMINANQYGIVFTLLDCLK